MEMNEVLDKLPAHLLSLVIEQPYNEYTNRDHAVWRYVMRQNVKFLSKVAHGSYVDGLKKTGISIDFIPHMYGMNRILKEIGWAAVAVDGFIPPSAFMEFQAYRVLVIAADIRPVDQIEYTPAPDIIHEAAGHAPIIADDEYSEYLRLFGKIGSKAFSSARDYELYEAVRHLSILKADPYSRKAEIEAAEKHLDYIASSMGESSEMAMIRNLHWWTVEYGLIGSLRKPKIYGAGLLSSIGESFNCLKDHVKKLPYSIDASTYNFDITTQQPQLFVTPTFQHLTDVLNEFSESMALRKGGIDAVKKAVSSRNTACIQLDSGLEISGTFDDCIIEGNEVVYIRTNSSTALSYKNKELAGHGKIFHKDGFGTPVGLLAGTDKPLHLLNDDELEEIGIIESRNALLKFNSGIVVSGIYQTRRRVEGKTLILTFNNCTVSYKDHVLFKPEWGRFDMATGSKIISGYSGPADPQAFGLKYEKPKETTHKIVHTESDIQLYGYYKLIREIREANANMADDSEELVAIENRISLDEFWNTIKANYPKEWLLMLELLEIVSAYEVNTALSHEILHQLHFIRDNDDNITKLINDGLDLILKPKGMVRSW
jgi:phenylalanine-4-hydroxylase